MSVSVTTIGFTQTTAEQFFARLQAAGVQTVFDVRLHNTSQLAGFAKAEDLKFFLERVAGIGYRHLPLLAPDETMLKTLKTQKDDWSVYAAQFTDLLAARRVETQLSPAEFDGACLLCSEKTPHHCHRSLVVAYLNQKWGEVLRVRHL